MSDIWKSEAVGWSTCNRYSELDGEVSNLDDMFRNILYNIWPITWATCSLFVTVWILHVSFPLMLKLTFNWYNGMFLEGNLLGLHVLFKMLFPLWKVISVQIWVYSYPGLRVAYIDEAEERDGEKVQKVFYSVLVKALDNHDQVINFVKLQSRNFVVLMYFFVLWRKYTASNCQDQRN
jgi:hypothetical protein